MPSGAHRYASVQVERADVPPMMHDDSVPEVMPRPLLTNTAAPGVLQRLTARKPLGVILSEEHEETLGKELSLFDLIAIGIGGTVGSGVFVLTGQIARENSGPAVLLSWGIAGVGCVLSGVAYAEMSSRVPAAGSCYAYSYFALGELPAFLASWLLTLEYAVSGSAVARSWGDKVYFWVNSLGGGEQTWMNYEYFSVMAGIVQLVCVVLLLRGISLGKRFINGMTCTKVTIIIFMIVAGLSAYNADNLSSAKCTAQIKNTPTYGGGFVPARHPNSSGVESFGWNGVIRGATAAFFGFIGFDEVCCMSAQAKDSQRTMPRAVIGTIAGTTILSMGAAFALVGMACYVQIDPSSGFASAFEGVGYKWAEQIVQAGEIATLPVVVLVSFLAQPQLQYAMSVDGLLPPLFKRTDANRNLFESTLWTGVLATLIAIFVPFTYLNDMISAGVLLSFNMTNTALLVTRSQRELQVTPKAVRKSGAFEPRISSRLTNLEAGNALASAANNPNGNGSDTTIPITSAPAPATTDAGVGADAGAGAGAGAGAATPGQATCDGTLDALLPSQLAHPAHGWLRDPSAHARSIMLLYNACALFFALIWQFAFLSNEQSDTKLPEGARLPLCTLSLVTLVGSYFFVTRAVLAGGVDVEVDTESFRAPFVPFVPCLGILFNCFLLSQFEARAWIMIVGYIGLATITYFAYGYSHSVGGLTGWKGTWEYSPYAVRTFMASGEDRLRHSSTFVSEDGNAVGRRTSFSQ